MKRNHFVVTKGIFTFKSSQSSRFGTFAQKMARIENHAKSNGEITGSRRFIEK